MKMILKSTGKIIFFLSLLIVSSCTDNEVEPIFEESINERTNILKSNYENFLTKPDNGWIGYYSPNNSSGAYAVVLDFDTNGGVKINSDYENGNQDNNITYRIDKTLKIELVFESFSVFSEIFSLNNNNNQGEFVFNIISASDEEILLESKLDYGDDITYLTLRPALADASNFDSIYDSLEKIGGDGTESVFRNILLNDEVIATFSFNTITRLTTVTYLNEDGDVFSQSASIAITPTGFFFLEPLDINGTQLTNFTYDETANEYVNSEDGLRILYDNLPGLPLRPYDFGNEDGNIRILRSNPNFTSVDQSSKAFLDFYDNWVQFFAATHGGRQISRVYVRSLNSNPYVHIYYFSGSNEFTLTFPCTYIVSETSMGDKVVTFTETLPVSTIRREGSLPMLEFIFREEGFYIQRMDPLGNDTLALIPVNDTSILSHWYDF